MQAIFQTTPPLTLVEVELESSLLCIEPNKETDEKPVIGIETESRKPGIAKS